MSLTITLAPEEEAQLQQRAKESGQTPEDYVLEKLRPLLIVPLPPQDEMEVPPLWRGLIGVLHSRQGSLSEKTGKQFAEGMAEKQREDNL